MARDCLPLLNNLLLDKTGTALPYYQVMEDFEWDDVKAQTNLAKHGVSFPDAARVFEDKARLEWLDD